MKTLATLCLLGTTTLAFAEPPDEDADAIDDGSFGEVRHFAEPPPEPVVTPVIIEPYDQPHCALPWTADITHTRDDVTNLLGFHIAYGRLPIAGERLQSTALGLSIEHRVAGRWRLVGEYEFTWLGIRDTEADDQMPIDGTAHHVQLGLRHQLLRSRQRMDGTLGFYADVEAGGGILLGSEPSVGTVAQPHAYAGLRLGYTFMNMRPSTRASIAWEPEVLLRANRVEDGYGFTAAIGMTWGD
ncbi:MAG TPA: hypothetical protein VFQ53_07770 [Kofleriaceae bacterium]|nr:hypothetical protein [Kofleriaceae bacterium]